MNKLFSKGKKLFILLILVFFMLILVIYPDKYTKSCYEGLLLWALTVLPSLLPFFFLTALLTRTGVLINLSKKLTPITKLLFKQKGISAYAFIMSILSGYPIGSRIVYDLYSSQIISKDEGAKMSVLATTSGPLFIIGAVGIGMFNSKIIGAIIYFSHVLSAVIVGIIFRNYGETSEDNIFLNFIKSKDDILYESIYSSIISALIVGGFVSVFYVFSDILIDFKILYPLEKIFKFIFSFLGGNESTSTGFLYGIIECTKGCMTLSKTGLTPLSVSLSASLISFGGFSIIMQSLTYLNKVGIKSWFFIKGKLIQTLLTFFISYVILLFCL